MRVKPKPMRPTPMIVADVFMPRPRVTATGTPPTTAKQPPMTITKTGPRNLDAGMSSPRRQQDPPAPGGSSCVTAVGS